MRSVLYAVVTCFFMLAGCAGRQGLGDLVIPDKEAIYDRPLEEMWPEVRQFFTENKLPYREDKGSFVLETEWREEFGASKVAGYWHRYMVLGKRESPTQSKLWVIRITKSANNTLSIPGREIGWGVSANLGGGPGGVSGMAGATAGMSLEDYADLSEMPIGENGFNVKSAQGSRDLVMEWRVFRSIAPRLMKEEKAPQLVQVAARTPNAAEAPSQLAVECGLPILGLGKSANPGTVMLLGEMHGTREVPRFLAQAACQSAVAGTPVTVGLELPLENQSRVDAFLDSAGTEDDWLKLMEAPFWRSPYPDGRSSEAVANLLEQLRKLREQNLDVDVFVYDHPKLQGQQREDVMAATVLRELAAGPKRFFLVLSGNIHSRTEEGLPWDEDYKPMGMLLSDKHDDVVALDMAYNNGTAWICAVDRKGVKDKLDCGVRQAKGRDNGDRFFVHLWGGTNGDGYHGVFYVGPVNASAPAVHTGLGRPGSKDNSGNPVREQQGASVASSP